MSRTYRRKKGYRFWTQEDYEDNFEHPYEFKNKNAMFKYFESDSYSNYGHYGVSKKVLKEFSVNSRRAKEHQQIHKIMKSDNEFHNYDDSFENAEQRNLLYYCLSHYF